MYIITVRPKAGELNALSFIPEHYRNQLIPNFIISAEEDMNKIIQKYPHPIWVDIRELQDFHKLPSIEQRIQENDEYIHAKIVYPLSYVLQHLVEPKHCVRFTPQDLSDDYSWLENYQHQLPHNILIDFGYISEIPNQNIKNNITKLINFLGNRNIVVASGSIPENLGISRTTNFNQPRYEKQFYQQLSAQSPTPIIYGDYGTVSPVSKLIDTNEIIVATVQLKYTREREYLFVRNGKRKAPYDIKSVAQELSLLSEFNENHCMGENQIRSISLGILRGSPTTWVSIGMNHHIMLCIEENL